MERRRVSLWAKHDPPIFKFCLNVRIGPTRLLRAKQRLPLAVAGLGFCASEVEEVAV